MATAKATGRAEENECTGNLLSRLKKLRDAGRCVDLTLITNDGASVKCHALVAATNSPYIKECIENSNLSDNEETGNLDSDTAYTVKVKTANLDVILPIVEYFYTGRLMLTQDTIKHTLLTAKLLRIKAVVNRCKYIVKNHISSENYEEYLDFGKQHNLDLFAKLYLDNLADKFDYLLQSQKIVLLDFEVFFPIVKSDHCSCTSEDDILMAVVLWLQANKDKYGDNEFYNISKHLLDCVRFEHCSSNALYDLLVESVDLGLSVEVLLHKKCLLQVCCVRAQEDGSTITKIERRTHRKVRTIRTSCQ